MHFKTLSHWEYKNPIDAVFDEPEHPCFRWRAVELPLAVYYYQVHFVPNTISLNISCTNFLLVRIEDVLEIISKFPKSTIYLLTPSWANNGEPGLYRVNALFKTTNASEQIDDQMHIAECVGGKIFALDILAQDINDLNLSTVEKIKLWPPLKKRRKKN